METSTNKNQKKEIAGRVVTLTLLFLALVFASVYIVSMLSSLGWFSSDRKVRASDMTVTLSDDNYDILVERTSEYDTMIDANTPKYENMSDFKTKLMSPGYDYSFIKTSTSEGALAYELVNEYTYYDSATPYKHLMPGSYGTLTFYLRPKTNDDVVADIDLTLGCFKKMYDSNNNYVIQEETDQTVLDYLKGHILFFEGRTGNGSENFIYSDFINTDSFVYDTSEHQKCTDPGKTDCYKITLYWEWPLTYSDIEQNMSQTEGEMKYPPALQTYIEAYRNYFFAVNQSSSDLQELDDGYNDADQSIGVHADFIVVYMEFN